MATQKDERGDPVGQTYDPARKMFSARESRQGGRGLPVLKVLGASLALAALVWGAVELWGDQIDPTTRVNDTGAAATTTSGDPAQDITDDTVPGNSQTMPTARDPTPQTGTGGDSEVVTPDGTSN